jgi:staphyloferrin B biosynthesis citrate synthase
VSAANRLIQGGAYEADWRACIVVHFPTDQRVEIEAMPDDTLPDITNPVRRRMEAGDLALGLILRLSRSGDIARIARASGHDFLFIDTQHAIFSLETIGHIAQAALGCGIAPLVRARSVRDPDVSLLLDSGVTGIVFPDVNTAEDARLAVRTCKFAPLGRRSVTSGHPLFDYRPVPQAQAIPLLNASTLVVCMIESREGLRNVEEIAAVEGVDVVQTALTDLLTDLGKPGALGDPEAMAAVSRVTKAALAHGKFAGVGGDNELERQRIFIRDGVRFISTQSDAALLMTAGSQVTRGLRDALKP